MNALQQSQNTLHLYLAGPDCAAGYRPQDLSDADRALLAAHPTRGGSTDWQVSRFIKQQAGTVSSLSHSRDHAALALAHGFAVGIDLEALRPRRFAHWREWILHADECRWLEENGADAANHYLLWTLKEALLKAAGLVLADMAAVGLRRSDNGVWQLHANGENWAGKVFAIGNSPLLSGCQAAAGEQAFLLAAVWPGSLKVQIHWQGFGRWRQPAYRQLAAFGGAG